jgi:hypothetical protein
MVSEMAGEVVERGLLSELYIAHAPTLSASPSS